MAEDSDLEKTEAATPKRLEKAREEGQVARSREFSSFALLSAGVFGSWIMSGHIGEHLQSMLRNALTFGHAGVFDTNQMMIGAGVAAREGLYALLPILALTGVAALLAGLLRDERALRLGALGLLALTAGKVFVFDLAALTSIYRVGSCIALGLLLLAGAFAWQRIRPRALPDLRGVPGALIGVLRQHAEPVSQVLPDCSHHSTSTAGEG